MKTVVLVLLVCGAISISHRNLQAQSGNEWSVARQSDMEIKVPSWCSITQGEDPAYICAVANTRGFFVCAQCTSIRDHPELSDEGVQHDLEQVLRMLQRHTLPIIGTLVLDLSALHVTDYKASGHAVSETTATLEGTGQNFKVFYLVAIHRFGTFCRLYILFVGCPESEISDYRRSMSYILDSFTTR